jgi:hypothetical protein
MFSLSLIGNNSIAASIAPVIYILIKSSFLHSGLFEKLAWISAHGTTTVAAGYTAGFVITMRLFYTPVFSRVGKFVCLSDSNLSSNVTILLLDSTTVC